MNIQRLLSSAALAWLLFINPAHAHFAWLAQDADSNAEFFFGESIAERNYHLPEKLASVEVVAYGEETKKPVKMKTVEEADFVGLKSEAPTKAGHNLACQATYGLYQGSKLTYHAQHVSGEPTNWSQKPNDALKLQAVLTSKEDGGVQAQILKDGKPLADAKVQLFCSDGHEEGVGTTDSQGRVQFTGSEVEEGLNGLLVGHVDPQSSGDYEGKPYKGEANYLTVTFRK